jgi:hypothetical protein
MASSRRFALAAAVVLRGYYDAQALRRLARSAGDRGQVRGFAGAGGDPSFYYSAPKGGMLWVFSVDGSVSESSKYSQDVIPAILPDYKP